jgi:hypothetical protein
VNGGHATLSLRSDVLEDESLVKLYDAGNGLQYVKVGNDILRLSKAIANGKLVLNHCPFACMGDDVR